MTEPYDFTALPIGTKTERGEVLECPYCKKNAVLAIIYDVKWYYHTLASYWIDENQTTMGVIELTCPVSPAQREEHEAAQSE